MAKILIGAPVKEKIKEALIERVKKLSWEPCLAVVQVGDREDSNIYIKNKIKFGEEVGVKVILHKFDDDTTEEALIKEIEKLNADKSVNGIIVQLPLPENINREKILNSLAKEKDADGLVSKVSRTTLWDRSSSRVVLDTFDTIPATARAVMALLDYYGIPIQGKKAAVIGQGILAGQPIADELENRGAEVFRCDINTKNIPEIARKCDILVSAVGKAGLITPEFVNSGQTVIDVGISKVNGKIAGDVASNEVEPLVEALSLVPGGVGPLTVACLFENLLDLCYHNSQFNIIHYK